MRVSRVEPPALTWVVLDEGFVEVSQLGTSQVLGLVGIRVLEVKVILALDVKLGGSHIHGNFDLSSVPMGFVRDT